MIDIEKLLLGGMDFIKKCGNSVYFDVFMILSNINDEIAKSP